MQLWKLVCLQSLTFIYENSIFSWQVTSELYSQYLGNQSSDWSVGTQSVTAGASLASVWQLLAQHYWSSCLHFKLVDQALSSGFICHFHCYILYWNIVSGNRTSQDIFQNISYFCWSTKPFYPPPILWDIGSGVSLLRIFKQVFDLQINCDQIFT